jgi:hypothetical protein
MSLSLKPRRKRVLGEMFELENDYLLNIMLMAEFGQKEEQWLLIVVI